MKTYVYILLNIYFCSCSFDFICCPVPKSMLAFFPWYQPHLLYYSCTAGTLMTCIVPVAYEDNSQTQFVARVIVLRFLLVKKIGVNQDRMCTLSWQWPFNPNSATKRNPIETVRGFSSVIGLLQDIWVVNCLTVHCYTGTARFFTKECVSLPLLFSYIASLLSRPSAPSHSPRIEVQLLFDRWPRPKWEGRDSWS